MRLARLKLNDRSAVYHCMSRIVGGQRLLHEGARERFVRRLWPLAAFCGVEVLTYCVMPNHFHLLVRVPAPAPLSDAQLLARLEAFYGGRGVLVAVARQAMATQGRLPEALRRGLEARLGDVSVFLKELKQRFSRWYNRQAGRSGTLWAERFKSVLVEDQAGAVATVAAYIDLNPVRAGLVEDPQDYRFSGYGAAVGGDGRARAGLLSVAGAGEWGVGGVAYRERLLVGAGTAGASGKVVLAPEAIRRLLAQGAALSLAQELRLRLRYLTDGVVLGTAGFVEEVFGRYRERFGRRRRSGARPVRGVRLGGLKVLRDLRVEAVT